jgi:hypothetical protein
MTMDEEINKAPEAPSVEEKGLSIALDALIFAQQRMHSATDLAEHFKEPANKAKFAKMKVTAAANLKARQRDFVQAYLYAHGAGVMGNLTIIWRPDGHE